MKKIVYSILSTILMLVSLSASSMESTPICVNEKLWNLSEKEIDLSLNSAKKLGVEYIRWGVPWKAVEEKVGEYEVHPNWRYIIKRTQELKIRNIIVLGYSNSIYDNGDKPKSKKAVRAFANYASFVVGQFQNEVRYFEVWNEWDGTIGPSEKGRVEDYVSLLKATYQNVKKSYPDVELIGGSFTGKSLFSVIKFGDNTSYFESFVGTNAHRYLDVVGLHPYVLKWEVEDMALAISKNLNLVKNFLDRSEWADKKRFITEIGWSTHGQHKKGVSPVKQASLLRESYKTANVLGYELFCIYKLKDLNSSGKSFEAHFGILNDKYELKFDRFSLK